MYTSGIVFQFFFWCLTNNTDFRSVSGVDQSVSVSVVSLYQYQQLSTDNASTNYQHDFIYI